MTSKLKWSDVVAIYGGYIPNPPDKYAVGKREFPRHMTGPRRLKIHQFGCNPPPVNRKLKLAKRLTIKKEKP